MRFVAGKAAVAELLLAGAPWRSAIGKMLARAPWQLRCCWQDAAGRGAVAERHREAVAGRGAMAELLLARGAVAECHREETVARESHREAVAGRVVVA